MPKLKIKDWKGIYSNIDENDASLEYTKDSVNFKHNRGYVEFEPLSLSTTDIPNLANEFPTYAFKWETGIYCTLSNDPLAETPVPAVYDITVLIAKVWDATVNKWHRVIYMRQNSGDRTWYELSKYGNYPGIPLVNHVNHTDFSESMFSTNIEGKPFFQVEAGRLKIYFPHTAFWLGRLNRTFYCSHTFPNSSIDAFYLDKLIDGKSVAVQNSRVLFTISNINEGTVQLEEVPATATYFSEGTANPPRIDEVIGLPGSGTNYWFEYEFTSDDDGTKILNPIVAGETRHWFPAYRYDRGLGLGYWYYMRVWEEYNTLIKFKDGSTLEDNFGPAIQATYLVDGAPRTGKMYVLPVAGSGPGLPITVQPWRHWSYVYSGYSTYDKVIWLKEGANISEDGFDPTIKKYHVVFTGVFDEREETILSHVSVDNTFDTKWAIKISDVRLNTNANKRLTRIRVYVRLNDGTMADYELVRDIQITNPDFIDNTVFYIYPDALTGVKLTSNIGILLEPDRIHLDYQLKERFRSLITIDNISFGATSEDYATVYYSAVGGGNLMPDILYSANSYPLNNVSRITALVNVNNRVGIFTENSLYIVDIVDELGVLTFTIKSTLEFGVKNKDDVAEMQGGVAIHTRHGIYTTTGIQSNLISEPIDDIVKANFSTGTIKYNKYIHEVIYKPTTSENHYRFRFKDNVWEKIDKTYEYDAFLLTANDILIDQNGNIAYLTDDALHIYNSGAQNQISGLIKMNNTDLGEPSIDKLLNKIDADYTGSFSIVLYLDGVSTHVMTFNDVYSRTATYADYPLSKRKPFKKLQLVLMTAQPGTKIYGLEIDFSLLPRRRYN